VPERRDGMPSHPRAHGRERLYWLNVGAGTYRFSQEASGSAAVGICQPTQYPARSSVAQQMYSMFLRGCCRALR
jgi:hypothetical protein